MADRSGGANRLESRMGAAAIAISLSLSAACSSATIPSEPGRINILFIGNSLTYTNDLPGMLARILTDLKGGPVRVEAVAYADYGLQDHWTAGQARGRIAEGRWDWVIMQQGPSATEGRPSLIDYSARFAAEIEKVGARPALYMVWPASNRAFDFDGVSDSYRTAAEQIGGVFLPAGDAWRAAWRRDASTPLYGPDGFHPSVLGTYVAALVIAARLDGIDPRQVGSRIPTASGGISIANDLATLLQDAAAEALQAASGAPGQAPTAGVR
jgi:hypothetical protein